MTKMRRRGGFCASKTAPTCHRSSSASRGRGARRLRVAPSARDYRRLLGQGAGRLGHLPARTHVVPDRDQEVAQVVDLLALARLATAAVPGLQLAALVLVE